MQDTRILSLPNDANFPAPARDLGPGALYYGYTRDLNRGGILIKQGYLTLRRSGLAFSGGRMEISEGLETIPGNRTLAALEWTRIGQGLLGPFGYTHALRSFDAAKLHWDRPTWNVTVFGGRPTRGGFGGDQALAHLVDVGIILGPWRGFTLSGYYGHGFGGQVVGKPFSGEDADCAFVERIIKYWPVDRRMGPGRARMGVFTAESCAASERVPSQLKIVHERKISPIRKSRPCVVLLGGMLPPRQTLHSEGLHSDGKAL